MDAVKLGLHGRNRGGEHAAAAMWKRRRRRDEARGCETRGRREGVLNTKRDRQFQATVVL